MDPFTQNIIGIFGEKGQRWLANLPVMVEKLSEYWNLSNLLPVDNMSFNYVSKATAQSNQLVVLKIGCDEKVIRDEKQALEYFDGCGSILLIDYNEEYNALLLQQAIPGTSLKSLYPANLSFVIDCYAAVAQKLHSKPFARKHGERPISDWLKAIDNIQPHQLPEHLLKKAIHLKNGLLEFSTRQVFLHGDLHLDNVIKSDDEWLIIDPKGIVGKPEFDVAAFDFIHSTEVLRKLDVKALLESRIAYLSQQANLDAQRIKDWVFVRLILSAAWWVEDNGDPTGDIELANCLFA